MLNKKLNKYLFDKNYLLYSIILFGFILKLLTFANTPDLWWDSASYIGYGKWMWSGGEIGFFDLVRPPLLPLILGFFWKIGLDPLFFGTLIPVIAATASIWLTYEITQRIFARRGISLLAAFLVAIDPIIFNNSQHQLTEIPAMCLALFAINYYLKAYEQGFDRKNLILSGIFIAISFLTRFTFFVIFFALLLHLVSTEKIKKASEKARKTLIYASTAIIAIIPYLLYNFLMFGDAIFPWREVAYEMNLAGNVIDYKLSFYLTEIPAVSLIMIMSIVGLILLLKQWKDEKNKLLLLLLLMGALYHMVLVKVKVTRYAILFLPFLIIVTAYGVYSAMKHDKLLRNIMITFLVISSLASISLDIVYLKYSKTPAQDYLEQNYYNYFDKPEYYGVNVMSTGPYPTGLSDVRFYSLFLANTVSLKEYEAQFDNFYVMFSSIDNPCDTHLESCKRKEGQEAEAFDYIYTNYLQVHNLTYEGTNYYIFKYQR